MNSSSYVRFMAIVLTVFSLATFSAVAAPPHAVAQVLYKSAKIDNVDIFYREAGDPGKPTLLLLHGFPTSSHMFRNLIPALAGDYHIVAPDYPGYGNSSTPSRDEFKYTFDNVAGLIGKFVEELGLQRYALYLQDYGAPIGFRLAVSHPGRVSALIVQNGNAYDEGIDNPFWEPIKKYWNEPNPANRDALRALLTRDATIWQYMHGVRNPQSISPDTWNVDQPLLDRPGNTEIQLDMFLSYGSNPPLYPQWQAYLRTNQPPTLIVWGKNDTIFPEAGAHPYLRDLEDVDFNLLDTGHFALEEECAVIATLIHKHLKRYVR